MERAQGANPSSLPLTQLVAEVHANRPRPQQTFYALDKGKDVATTSQFQRINSVIESRQDLNFNDKWKPTQTEQVYEDELDEGDEYLGEDDMYNAYDNNDYGQQRRRRRGQQRGPLPRDISEQATRTRQRSPSPIPMEEFSEDEYDLEDVANRGPTLPPLDEPTELQQHDESYLPEPQGRRREERRRAGADHNRGNAMPPRRQGRLAPGDYRFPPQAPVPPLGTPRNERRQPPPRHFNNNEDDLPPYLRMSRPTIKVKIDEFIGDFNPSTFLDWKQAT